MTQDRSDWLILLVAGSVATVLLLAVTAHNGMAGRGDLIAALPVFQPVLQLVY
jgi:hypothetical protein